MTAELRLTTAVVHVYIYVAGIGYVRAQWPDGTTPRWPEALQTALTMAAELRIVRQ